MNIYMMEMTDFSLLTFQKRVVLQFLKRAFSISFLFVKIHFVKADGSSMHRGAYGLSR